MVTNKIHILPQELVSKIAAGEVVERPASVVKELVENSIDAGATDISIHIQDGGKRIIKVVDDGEGMPREDAVLAFERHATSKIESEDDLFNILTMGFRGEALPSIASVSEVTLSTKVHGELTGTMVKVRGGRVEEVKDFGCPEGAMVEVKNLFYNTPARLKFLRAISTELGHIIDIVNRLAIVNPPIRFKLTNGPTTILNTSKGDLKARVGEILGTDVLKQGIAIEEEGHRIRLWGLVSNPNITYPTTKGLFIYVNNRWIRDKGINYAIINGYRHLLMKDRYPLAVLFIHLPPEDVDVNVHPAKAEVRFKDPRLVYELISKTLQDALIVPSMPVSKLEEAWPVSVKEAEPCYRTAPIVEEPLKFGERNVLTPLFLELGIIGQLWGEYILAEREGEFYIIDQHAASERIAFERLKNSYYEERRIKGQSLLIPEVLEVFPQEREALEGSLEVLNDLGFEVEPFGGNTFVIKTIPGILAEKGCAGLIKDLAEELSCIGVSSRIEKRIDDTLIRVACHAVVRGRHPLSKEEIKALLNELAMIDFSSHCPHGRPVIKAISRAEVEEMFKRR
ncbi:MAG: DNA mismatch repair endonuclease MutL [Deltaproteobacteria bacterium]|nr:DNA mismatch repair endonuclease MutL [Deltaproteobacteria bacterium]